VDLTVVLTNISDQTLKIGALTSFAGAALLPLIDIRDGHGNAPLLTTYGQKHAKGGEITSGVGYSVEPGKTLEEIIVLSKLYDLTPGQYSVQLHRPIGKTGSVVKSNVVRVNVVR